VTHEFLRALHILAVTDKGVQCATAASTDSPFWLPRGRYVEWAHPPQPGRLVTAIVPEWLASRHRQLVGDVAYECVRHADKQKETTMSDRAEDAGSGALFKNDKKEKPSHPDYRGDVTIHGRKFWISAWIKEGQKGKYMSLAFRPAEEQTEAKAKQPSRAMADDSIPF
jgi:hypothetical protein